jgi:hypothetical protein
MSLTPERDLVEVLGEARVQLLDGADPECSWQEPT